MEKFKDYSWQEFEIIYRDLESESPTTTGRKAFEDKMPAVLLELKNKGL